MAQVCIERRDHISVQDLEWFLPPTKAANALSVLDIDGDGKISLSDMRDAVVSIYKERKNLAFTLKVALLCIQLLGLLLLPEASWTSSYISYITSCWTEIA